MLFHKLQFIPIDIANASCMDRDVCLKCLSKHLIFSYTFLPINFISQFSKTWFNTLLLPNTKQKNKTYGKMKLEKGDILEEHHYPHLPFMQLLLSISLSWNGLPTLQESGEDRSWMLSFPCELILPAFMFCMSSCSLSDQSIYFFEDQFG